MAKRRAKIKRGFKRAGGFLGLGSLTDLAHVAVTSAGANYFANIGASALGGLGGNRWSRPVLAGLIAYVLSPRNKKNATIIGSVLIALSQAGVIGSLGGILGGSTNPNRGQTSVNQPNILGRLP